MAKEVDDLLDRLLHYPLIVREEGSVGGFLTPNDVRLRPPFSTSLLF